MKFRLSTEIVALPLAVLAACQPLQVQPSSLAVEGRVLGVDGTGVAVPASVTALAHTQAPSPRLVYRRDAGIQDVNSIALAATASTGLPFSEEWHFLHITNQAQRPGADPLFLQFTGEPGFMDEHDGNLAWLVIRKNDIHLPSDSFSAFPAADLRASGCCVLARVEDDDPVLPWTVTDGCSNLSVVPFTSTLRVLGPATGDCFDMQTLSSLLFNNIALAVANAAADNDARVNQHRLAIIPTLPVSSGPGEPLPGFGYVYEADFEPIILGQPSGPFVGPLTIKIPISINWLRDANGFRLGVDPIAGLTATNIPRITVYANEGTLSAGQANEIRTQIATAIAATPLPSGPGGMPFTAFLELFFTDSLAGPGALPTDFQLLALPSSRGVLGAPRNIAMSMGPIIVTDSVGPGADGGVGAQTIVVGPGGSTVVFRNLNDDGTLLRTFIIPVPEEPMPFDLHLLR